MDPILTKLGLSLTGKICQLALPSLLAARKEKRETDAIQKSLADSVNRGFEKFAKKYGDLSNSFFDETFLENNVATEFSKLLSRASTPDAILIEKKYRAQFTTSLPSNLSQAIKDFLYFVEDEMKKEAVLQSIINSRQIEAIHKKLIESDDDWKSIRRSGDINFPTEIVDKTIDKEMKILHQSQESKGEIHVSIENKYAFNGDNEGHRIANNTEATPSKVKENTGGLFEKNFSISDIGELELLLHGSPTPEYTASVINAWSSITGRNIPTASETIAISKRVLLSTIASGAWENRRRLSHIFGKALSNAPIDQTTTRLIGEIAEISSESTDGQIFFSTSFSSNGDLIHNYKNYIFDLAEQPHPQVSWQLFRQPKFLPYFLENPNLGDLSIDKASSQWLRRRLILSASVNLPMKSNPLIADRKSLSILRKLVSIEKKQDGLSFLKLLSDWVFSQYGESTAIAFNTCIGYQKPNKFEVRQYLKDRSLQVANIMVPPLIIPNRFEQVEDSVHLIEMFLLYFELPSSPPHSQFKQGRYGIILQWVKQLLSRVSSELRVELFSTLANTHDEGIRWAVAKSVPDVFFENIDCFSMILLQLIEDKHAWVQREAIDSLLKIYLTKPSIDISVFIRKILRILTIRTPSKDPAKEEVMRAFLRLAESVPHCFKYFDLKLTEGYTI